MVEVTCIVPSKKIDLALKNNWKPERTNGFTQTFSKMFFSLENAKKEADKFKCVYTIHE